MHRKRNVNAFVHRVRKKYDTANVEGRAWTPSKKLLQLVCEWMEGNSTNYASRYKTLLSIVEQEKVPEDYRRVDKPLYRGQQLDDKILKELEAGTYKTTSSSWTTSLVDAEYFTEFKGRWVIFKYTPNPKEIVLNVSKIFNKFRDEVEEAHCHYVEEAEVLLHPVVLSKDNIYKMGKRG